MHPVLFEFGGIKLYSYGFLIAVGALCGIVYMASRGKKELGVTFDQANSLFLYIFLAAFVGGKVFLFFESPDVYLHSPQKLLTGKGFVFYGSFLFAIPTMLWFFKKEKIPTYAMLDIMAVTTCLVHVFGRIGCFMAGCCYGKPTDSFLGVTFSDVACEADPKGVPLHPTQLYESAYIFLVLLIILYFRGRKKFYGQLFLMYLVLYAGGRFVLEYFRGDAGRGFIIEGWISHSQFVALCVMGAVMYVYLKWSVRNKLSLHTRPI